MNKNSTAVAEELFRKFRFDKDPQESIKAALEMKAHFDHCQGRESNDDIGKALIDIMIPKRRVEKSFMGRPVHDLTGGRPDTPEWIMFLLIVDSDNYYYYEYFSAMDSLRYRGTDLKWTVPLLRELCKTVNKDHVKDCHQLINDIS